MATSPIGGLTQSSFSTLESSGIGRTTDDVVASLLVWSKNSLSSFTNALCNFRAARDACSDI